jgi:2-dehydro-3-deoxyphosphooctonate aldolase (KDO 8-P synthase)
MTIAKPDYAPAPAVSVGPHRAGDGAPLLFICGPCVIESEAHALKMAGELKKRAEKLKLQLVFKASYDKANRSAGDSFRGPGLDEGLRILEKVKKETGLPVLSDVHEISHVKAAGEVLDILQIPAFLCRQTDLLIAAAETGKVVNVKKGQFLSPDDTKNIRDKVASVKNSRLLLTERGASFGYNNLVVDFRSFQIMRSFGVPVIFDVTHSVQIPGGLGRSSAGKREFIPLLARAGAAAGVDGFFFEVHDNPEAAKSDGPNALPLDWFEEMMERILAIRAAAGPMTF